MLPIVHSKPHLNLHSKYKDSCNGIDAGRRDCTLKIIRQGGARWRRELVPVPVLQRQRMADGLRAAVPKTAAVARTAAARTYACLCARVRALRHQASQSPRATSTPPPQAKHCFRTRGPLEQLAPHSGCLVDRWSVSILEAFMPCRSTRPLQFVLEQAQRAPARHASITDLNSGSAHAQSPLRLQHGQQGRGRFGRH